MSLNLNILSVCAVVLALTACGGGNGAAPLYKVGGTVTGLNTGNTVVLNNAIETLSVVSNNSFEFNIPVTSAYSVSVTTHPYWQTCSVTNPSGLAIANITNIAVNCSAANAVVTTLAGAAGSVGTIDGTGVAARFSAPNGIAADSSGNIFVADSENHTIRKITAAGVVTTLAGTAGVFGATDGQGTDARFLFPEGIAVDSSGNVFVMDSRNSTIRKITSNGVVTTLAGTARSVGSTDGIGAAARFADPMSIAVDSNGNIFVADTYNHTIRKITSAGVVTTIAGTAGQSGSTDAIGAAARFNTPYGVAADSSGNIFVADYENHTIRKITSAGVVTTLAGTAGVFGTADGQGTNAKFRYPHGIAVDSSGNVFITDSVNRTIRKITPAGVVTTLAGTAGVFGYRNDVGSAARFTFPVGVAVDLSGNVYVADMRLSNIRKITPTP